MTTAYTPFKLKRSAEADKIPLTTDLLSGELAVNIHDGKLFFKKTVGGVNSIVALQAYSGGTGINVDTSTGLISTKQDIAVTASPTFAGLTLNGGIVDNLASLGSDGQVLQSTGTGVKWASPAAASGAVTYTANQGLNATQQANARANIGALSDGDIWAYALMGG